MDDERRASCPCRRTLHDVSSSHPATQHAGDRIIICSGCGQGVRRLVLRVSPSIASMHLPPGGRGGKAKQLWPGACSVHESWEA